MFTRRLILISIGLIGLLLLFLVDNFFRDQQQNQHRLELQKSAERIRDHIETYFRAGLTAVETLANHMLEQEHFPDLASFDTYARQLLSIHTELSAVAYVDADMIIRHFYPLAGNESAIGLDLNTRPAARFVRRAQRLRVTTLNDPTVTVQGQLAVIARTPLYKGDEFLGIVQGIYRVGNIGILVRDYLVPGMHFQLLNRHDDPFWGAVPPAKSDLHHSVTIPVGDNYWKLTVWWQQGTRVLDSSLLALIWLSGIIIIFGLIYGLHRNWSREDQLHLLSHARNSELQDINKRLLEEIDDHREARHELEAMQRRFRILFDHANDAVFLSQILADGQLGRFMDVNQQACDMLAYSREELLVLNPVEIVAAHARPQLMEQKEHLIDRQQGLYATQFLSKDNKSIPVECSSHIFELDGTMVMFTIARDITERKQSEEITQRFGRILDTSANEIYVFDAESLKFTKANLGALHNLRYSMEELMHLTPIDIIADMDRESFLEHCEPLAQGKSILVLEAEFCRKDGSRYPVEMRLHYSGQEQPPVYVVIALDISGQKRAQNELLQARARLEQLLVASPVIIYSADPTNSNALTYLSNNCQALFGYSPIEFTRNPSFWLQCVHPEDRARIQAERSQAGDEDILTLEYRLLDHHGTYRWVLDESRLLLHPQTSSVERVGYWIDITDRKLAEQEAKQRHDELAHANRFASMGKLASGLAHELNQPLSAILNFARAGLRRAGNNNLNADEVKELLDKIGTQAQRAADIMQGMRDFIHKRKSTRSAIDINQIVRQSLQFIQPEATANKVAIRLYLSPSLPLIYADAIQIEQVLLNLCRNAIEAITDSGSERRELIISTELNPSHGVVVHVEDSGPGMNTEQLQQASESFYTTKDYGMGLGLSISRSIIENHGGHFEFNKRSNGDGMRFSFMLPKQAEERHG